VYVPALVGVRVHVNERSPNPATALVEKTVRPRESRTVIPTREIFDSRKPSCAGLPPRIRRVRGATTGGCVSWSVNACAVSQ
jgi:hypothetical protein